MPDVDANHLRRLFGLDGKIAAVTGAGSGIGRAIAFTLARAGATVIAGDIDERSAGDTVKGIIDFGAAGAALHLDISDERSVTRFFVATAEAHGGLDVLVNNAGIFPQSPLLETTPDKWDRVFAVNMRGTFLCLREGVKLMKDAGRGGAIVNISAASALAPLLFDNADYSASKAGVNNLTRGAALEFAASDIRINAVLPGAIRTQGAAQVQNATQRGPVMNPERWPLGFGEAEQIASAVLFLVSPAAAFVTGQLLAVDGGFLVS